jgi:hypothetical protein
MVSGQAIASGRAVMVSLETWAASGRVVLVQAGRLTVSAKVRAGLGPAVPGVATYRQQQRHLDPAQVARSAVRPAGGMMARVRQPVAQVDLAQVRLAAAAVVVPQAEAGRLRVINPRAA